METCFLDLLDSLWGGGRASLKLSASGSRHSGSTWPMSILDSIPKVREKAHRRMCGRECVHVGGGESRVKDGKSWVISSPYSFFPLEPLAQGGRQCITEYVGPVGKNIHWFHKCFWAHMVWEALCLAWVHGADEEWSPKHLFLTSELSPIPTSICIITQHIQVPKIGSISWF